MALNTEKQIKSIFYNNTEIPLAAGSSGGNGFSITFPATAANWNNMRCSKKYTTVALFGRAQKSIT